MSLRILSFNTSTEVCSVALMINNSVNEYSAVVSYQHEKIVLSMIDQILSEADITLESLDFLVVCRGPGSFVGVRLGISLAQGLALGTNLPLVQVSSLEVLAQSGWRLMKNRRVLATINARMGELYLACYYRQDNGIWLGKDTESLINPFDMSLLISKLDGSWVLVGTGWNNYPILLSDDILQKITQKRTLHPLAQDMFPIAIEDWKQGNILTVNQIEPIYLTQIKWNRLFKNIDYHNNN